MSFFSSFTNQDKEIDPVRLWSIQLYREYERILFQFRLRVRPAVLKVDELNNQWGNWNPSTQTITISKRLIRDYSWDVVIEVLKHECAHQLVSERGSFSTPHGAEFRRACDQLGLRGWAAQASGEIPREIPRWRDRALTEDEERLTRKVEKLLSLATSTNEHEALLAMQRVREIYAKYNLDRVASNNGATYEYLILDRKRKKISSAESIIYSILVEHFFVRVVFSSLYSAEDLCEYKVAEILGTRQNLLMAEYVFHFLLSRTEALWDSYRRSSPRVTARMKNSYVLGLLSGFQTKLRQMSPYNTDATPSERPPEQSHALIKISDKELQLFMDSRYPRRSNRSTSGAKVYGEVYKTGQKEGRNITLNKGLTRSTTYSGLTIKSSSER